MTVKPRDRSILEGTQYVYYVYSGDCLLYVGVTGSIRQRMNSHRSTKPWWPANARIETEEYPNRRAAEDREAELIERLSPPHNLPPRPVLFASVSHDLAAAVEVVRGDLPRSRFIEIAIANEVQRRKRATIKAPPSGK